MELPASIAIPRLLVDNTATLSTASQGILSRQNRHFLVKYYWLHEQVDEGKITPYWVSTEDQLADVLTKPPTPQNLKKFVQLAKLGN